MYFIKCKISRFIFLKLLCKLIYNRIYKNNFSYGSIADMYTVYTVVDSTLELGLDGKKNCIGSKVAMKR